MLNFYNSVIYTVRTDAYRMKLFEVRPDNSFFERDTLLIRIDGVLKNPLTIKVNPDEWSLTINDLYGILFKDEFALEEFLEEIFFVMEEFHGITGPQRSTSPQKLITNLQDLLAIKMQGKKKWQKIH